MGDDGGGGVMNDALWVSLVLSCTSREAMVHRRVQNVEEEEGRDLVEVRAGKSVPSMRTSSLLLLSAVAEDAEDERRTALLLLLFVAQVPPP
jgi:hypothetical protein